MQGISRKISWNRAFLVLLVVVAGSFGALVLSPSAAYAACPAGTHDSGTLSNRGLENCVADDPSDTTAQTGVHAQDTSPAEAPNLAAAGLAAVLAPFVLIAWVIFKIGSLLLGLAGFLFNWSMEVVVFQFATYLGNSPGMLAAWSVLRDFGNIVLLFGFVFVGISTILDLHSYPWKKTLPLLVIFAVLLNFSLFAAETVIDSTNVLSAVLYDQAYTPGNACSTQDSSQCVVNTGVASQILQKINITSVYQDQEAQTAGDSFSFIGSVLSYAGDPLPFLLKFVALALVVTVAAVVLIAGAIMLISRGVILAFLMVTSPIGFAGMAIPGLNKIAQDWWHKLINQALFAPVYLLLILVALKMTDGLASLAGQSGGLASAISANNAINTGPLFLFALIIGFLIAALMIAQKFGIYGADFATATAGRAVYGTMGFMGRRTIGSGAQFLARRNAAALVRTPMGRLTLGGLKALGKGNYDLTSTSGGKTLAKLANVNLGTAQHGGIDHIDHEAAKKLDDMLRKADRTTSEKAQVEAAKAGVAKEKGRGATLDESLKANAANAAGLAPQQAAIDAQKTQLAADKSAREAGIAAQRQVLAGAPLYALADEQTKLDALEATNQRESSLASTLIAQQQEALDAQKKFYEDAAASLRSDMDASRQRLAERTEEQRGVLHDTDPQRQLAAALRKELKDMPFLRGTAAGYANEHTAHELDEWADKSPSARAQDEMIAALKGIKTQAHKDSQKELHEIHLSGSVQSGGDIDEHVGHARGSAGAGR